MISRSRYRLFLLAALVPLLGACSDTAPYIYNADEFNRDSPNFGKEPTDIDNVAICYNKSSTTPQDLLALAESACTKFGKTAVFKKQDIFECPLLTPAQAHFSCTKPPH